MARIKEFKEQEALQKAVEIFWRQGFHATSMEDLTVGLGLSRSSLYDTFGNKHTLLMSALAYYTGQARQGVLQLLERTLTGKEKIQLLVKEAIEAFGENTQQKGCFVVNVATELANQDVEVQYFTQNNITVVTNIFKQIIKQGQEDGSIACLLPAEDLAYHVFNIYNGLQVSGKMGASQETLWRMWKVNELLF